MAPAQRQRANPRTGTRTGTGRDRLTRRTRRRYGARVKRTLALILVVATLVGCGQSKCEHLAEQAKEHAIEIAVNGMLADNMDSFRSSYERNALVAELMYDEIKRQQREHGCI